MSVLDSESTAQSFLNSIYCNMKAITDGLSFFFIDLRNRGRDNVVNFAKKLKDVLQYFRRRKLSEPASSNRAVLKEDEKAQIVLNKSNFAAGTNPKADKLADAILRINFIEHIHGVCKVDPPRNFISDIVDAAELESKLRGAIDKLVAA